MSFILDALRKSDQLRQSQTAPTLPAMPPAAPVNQRPSLLASAAIGAVLLAIGLLIGWWQPWSPPVSGSPPIPAMPAPPPAAPPMIATNEEAPRVAAPRQLPASVPAPAQPSAQPAAIPAAPKAPERGMANLAAAAATATTAPPAEAAGEAPPPLALTELPPGVLAELPKMAVAAHSYSKKPKAGFVFINDRMLHEEDTLAPGLKLERITPDGMIFSYRGYRFRRGLQP